MMLQMSLSQKKWLMVESVAVGIPLVIKPNTVRFTYLFLCRGCVLHFVFSYCLFDVGFSF